MSTEYNGHPSWEHWNVSLWLFNDEGWYHDVRFACRRALTLDDAADILIGWLPRETPDGAPFAKEYVLHAIEDEWDELNPEDDEDDDDEED